MNKKYIHILMIGVVRKREKRECTRCRVKPNTSEQGKTAISSIKNKWRLETYISVGALNYESTGASSYKVFEF